MNKKNIEEFFEHRTDCKNYNPVVDLTVPLYFAHRLLLEGSERFCKKNGLSSSELDVLRTLTFFDKPLTPTELYEGMLFSSGGMTKVLKRLESTDLIKRTPCERDKRSKLVEITDRGKELSRRVLEEIISDKERVFSCLDEGEQEVMKRALEKVVRNLL